MGKVFVSGLVLCLLCSVALIGCGSKKAESTSAAIEQSKAMQTVQEKADYLIGQAKAFYNSKDFQGAVSIAQYVLSSVDKESKEASSLIEKAKQQLTALAEQKAAELKSKLGIGQ